MLFDTPVCVLFHGAHAPLRAVRRPGLQRRVDHLGDALVAVRPRSARAQFVAQSLQAVLGVAPAPLGDRVLVDLQAGGHGRARLAVRAGEHDLRTLHQPMRQGAGTRQAEEVGSLCVVQDDGGCGTWHGASPDGRVIPHRYTSYLWDTTLGQNGARRTGTT